MVMRLRDDTDPRGWRLHHMSGLELMQHIGFDSSYLQKPVAARDDVLAQMSGNAFSAFVIAAVLGTTVPLLHTTQDDYPAGTYCAAAPKALPDASDAEDCLSVGSSSSSD